MNVHIVAPGNPASTPYEIIAVLSSIRHLKYIYSTSVSWYTARLLVVEDAKRILEDCGGVEKLEGLQSSPSEKIYQKTIALLERHFDVDDEENWINEKTHENTFKRKKGQEASQVHCISHTIVGSGLPASHHWSNPNNFSRRQHSTI